MAKWRQGADTSCTKRRTLHDGSVELDETFFGEARTSASIEERIVLEDADRGLYGIERRSALRQHRDRCIGRPAASIDATDVAIRAARSAMHQDRPPPVEGRGRQVARHAPRSLHDHETLRCSIQASSVS